MQCAICAGTNGTGHIFREMMFGTRSEFPYWECNSCGCLQIVAPPNDLSSYYPEDYYAFSQSANRWKTWYYKTHFIAPRLMRKIRRCSADIASVIEAAPKKGARILDVGCGGGRLVEILRNLGFDAHGIDPFAASSNEFVKNATLENVDGGWDLIMFHHSLEHRLDQVQTLQEARNKLKTGGTCLVRIPVATWAWQHYGRDWAQLDAPRHLIIHTPKSFWIAANSAGFATGRTIFDSNIFMLYASELYRRGIPLHGTEFREKFSAEEMRAFGRRADEFNRQGQGDQAAFIMRK